MPKINPVAITLRTQFFLTTLFAFLEVFHSFSKETEAGVPSCLLGDPKRRDDAAEVTITTYTL